MKIIIDKNNKRNFLFKVFKIVRKKYLVGGIRILLKNLQLMKLRQK